MQDATSLQVCLDLPIDRAKLIRTANRVAILAVMTFAASVLNSQEIAIPQISPQPLTSATLSAEILASQSAESLAPVQPVAHPLAIVPLESKIPGGAAQVSGAVQVFNGRAFITDSGTRIARDHDDML